MGRKKRKRGDGSRCQPVPSAASVGVSGGQLRLWGVDGAAASDDAIDANRADEQIAHSGPSVQSSWFPEVKWIARREDELQKPVAYSSTSLSREEDSQHASLRTELARLKEQLMPAAKACADAVNECQPANTTPEYEFRQARAACNPFERLGETFSKRKRKKFNKRTHQQSSSGLSQFVNRSAIKLANIDGLLGFCLTSSVVREPQSAKDETEPFVFVDLCGAPGGFSEYILYRHVHPVTFPGDQQGDICSHNEERRSGIRPCYGFGMSLSGANEDGKGVPWDLAHLKRYHLHVNASNTASESNGKLHYRVCAGKDGTGSIYQWANVLQLQRDIVASVSRKEGAGDGGNSLASLVVADGGFDAQRDSNNQEALAHKLIASQAAAALTLLRPGGVFVLKMFGSQEEATRRLMRYLYGCFDKMTFVKPVSSRPASAERYLVCYGYGGHSPGWDGLLWRDQMMDTSQISDESKDDGRDRLDERMDCFDRDMLQLNIDTCRSIIAYMDDRRDAVQQGNGATVHMQQHDDCLNIQDYEAAWQLFASPS